MGTLTPKTYIWAHRGASGHAPENTLEAFALAAKMGADGVELDVRFTKDGEIVIAHDEKLDRISNGQGLIGEYTYEQLLAFDFGYKFYGEVRGIKIATLRQVYELLEPTGLMINIEIKGSDMDMPARCIEIAKEFHMEDRTHFSAFCHKLLLKVHEVAPEMQVAPLYSNNLVYAWDYCGFLQASAVHPLFSQVLEDEKYVENCHNKGVKVNVWTANTEKDIQTLLEASCDGIITNYPDLAIKLRDEYCK